MLVTDARFVPQMLLHRAILLESLEKAADTSIEYVRRPLSP